MTNEQRKKLAAFNAAKKIALTIEKGCYRRAMLDDEPVSYCGFRSTTGRSWVIGDSSDDLKNPDGYFDGKPAREVFADFTMVKGK